MARFSDNKGRPWTLAITHGDAIRVKQGTPAQVDLYGLMGDKLKGLAELMGNPVGLVEVVWILIEPAATKLGVTPEEFGFSLDGAALEAMSEAFYDALADFFQKARPQLMKLKARGQEVADLMSKKAMEQLDKMDVQQAFDKLCQDLKSGGSSTN